jgi:hypothetical protein
MTKLNDEGQESILQEAHRLTHGDRNATYAHPFDDYSCTAALFTAILGDKLKSPITAHEMALGMCCVKLSRESRVPKRDNMVDLAGYAWVARMCIEEGERREREKAQSDLMAFGTGVGFTSSKGFEYVPLRDFRSTAEGACGSQTDAQWCADDLRRVINSVDRVVDIYADADDEVFPLHPDDEPLPTSHILGGYPRA